MNYYLVPDGEEMMGLLNIILFKKEYGVYIPNDLYCNQLNSLVD